jgi:Tfp pilus assembly protein PilE
VRGFTIIEIIVVVAVTILLSSYVVSYTRTGQRQILLYAETQKLASSVLMAKSLAIESFADTRQGNCGYGLAIDYGQKNYSIFYYATSTTSNQPKYAQCPTIKKDGELLLDRITPFSAATRLSSELAFRFPAPADAIYYVLFVPPDPETLIAGSDGTIFPGSGSIYLQTSDGLAKLTVTVNPAGQVNF